MLVRSITKSSQTFLCPRGLEPTRLLCPWNLPGKYTGVDCHFLLQVIFPTQRSNPCLLHWQADSSPPPEKSVCKCNYLWDGLSLDFSIFCKMHPPPPTEVGVGIGAWSHIHITWLPTSTADWIQSGLIQLVSHSSRIGAQFEFLVQLKLQRQTFESCEMPHPGMITWEEATG